MMRNYGLTFITNQDLFKHLCQVLPIVIKDVTRSLKISSKNNTVIGGICQMICNENTC